MELFKNNNSFSSYRKWCPRVNILFTSPGKAYSFSCSHQMAIAVLCDYCIGTNSIFTSFREGRGAIVRGWSSANVAAYRAFSSPSWCRISEKYNVSHLSILGNCLCPCARQFTIKCFTWLRCKWVPDRTEIAMCTISSMRRNGCRTVCSPLSWNGTRMNRSSDQGVNCMLAEESLDLIPDYKPAPLPLPLSFFNSSQTTSDLNPLSPHDALKHHFTSLKLYLIFRQLRVLERKFPWNWFTNTWQFSLIFNTHQVIFIHYKSRIATAIRGL